METLVSFQPFRGLPISDAKSIFPLLSLSGLSKSSKNFFLIIAPLLHLSHASITCLYGVFSSMNPFSLFRLTLCLLHHLPVCLLSFISLPFLRPSFDGVSGGVSNCDARSFTEVLRPSAGVNFGCVKSDVSPEGRLLEELPS